MMNKKTLFNTICISLLSVLTCSSGCQQGSHHEDCVPFIFTVELSDIRNAYDEHPDIKTEAQCAPLYNFADQGEYVMPIRIQKAEGAAVDYDLDCDHDGDYEFKGLTDSHECRYRASGTYQIAVRGMIPGLYLGDESSLETDEANKLADEYKKAGNDRPLDPKMAESRSFEKRSPRNIGYFLRSVDQWGTIPWKTMRGMFKGCYRAVIAAEDAPVLNDVTDMSAMFAHAFRMNQNIGYWNTSGIRNMSGMFYGAHKFNQPLSSWDVSNVTDMRGMFSGAHSFDQPLSSWDVSNVTDMRGMFSGAYKFNQLLGSWDVSHVTDMRGMFSGAYKFNQPLGSWDVSHVTDMRGMFSRAYTFNQPLGSWDVSHVTNMSGMFSGAYKYNQPLGSWDVSHVADMRGMFSEAYLFNQPLSSWNVSHVADMSGMFSEAHSFDQPLSSWKVSHVADMSGMFSGAYKYNQPMSFWKVSHVTDMSGMFSEAHSFDQPLSSWKVSNVTDMSGMFSGAHSFNQPLSSWNVSNVTDMSGMFSGAYKFNQPLSSWNVSNVTDMSGMFSGAAAFNQPLSSWNVSNVTDMSGMFSGAHSFDQPLESWNVSNVRNMSRMFKEAESFNQRLDRWQIRAVDLGLSDIYSFVFTVDLSPIPDSDEKISAMAGQAPVYDFNDNGTYVMPIRIHPIDGAEVRYDLDCDNDGTFEFTGLTGDSACRYITPGPHQIAVYGKIPGLYLGDESSAEADMLSEFADNTSPAAQNLNRISPAISKIAAMIHPRNVRSPRNMGYAVLSVDQWGTIPWKTTERMFKGCYRMTIKADDIPDLTQVGNMRGMFAHAFAVNQDISRWNTSAVTDMRELFYGAETFNQPLGSWDVSHVTDMSGMFAGAAAFNQPLGSWKVSEVRNMNGMFSGAAAFNQPLGSWDVSHVTDMSGMFSGAAAFNQPLDTWKALNVTDMSGMFSDAAAFNQPLDTWNVSHVTNMSGMFSDAAAFNQPLDTWNVSNVRDMSRMFADAETFNQPLGTWNVSNVRDMSGMFAGARAFNYSIENWNISEGTDTAHMMDADRPFIMTVGLMNSEPYEFTSSDKELYETRSRYGDMPYYFEYVLSAPQYRFEVEGKYYRMPIRIQKVPGEEVNYDLDCDNDGVYEFTGLTGDSECRYDIDECKYWETAPLTGERECRNHKSKNWRSALIRQIAIRGKIPGLYLGDESSVETDTANEMRIRHTLDYAYFFDDLDIDILNPDAAAQKLIDQSQKFEDRTPRNIGSVLVSIDQWGSNRWKTMRRMLKGCYLVDIKAADAPNLSDVRDMSEMLAYTVQYSGGEELNNEMKIGHWNTSSVSDMSKMFYRSGAQALIEDWDVSNVKDMRQTFAHNSEFNRPIGNWDTSHVTDMSGMFENSGFNQPIGNWDTSHVTDMSRMFYRTAFDHPISGWDVSHVTDMRGMFYRTPFNQPLDSWDVSNVTDMSRMFEDSDFNYPIGGWNTSKVTTMKRMFRETPFNQPIGHWDTSHVTDMSGMFEHTDFNYPIGGWNTSKVTTMKEMFCDAESFNRPLGDWDTSHVTDMSGMFKNAKLFNQPLEKWNTSEVTSIMEMFKNAAAFNQPVGSWNIKKLTAVRDAFAGAESFRQPLQSWNLDMSDLGIEGGAGNTGKNNRPFIITVDLYDPLPPVTTSEPIMDLYLYDNPFKFKKGDEYIMPIRIQKIAGAEVNYDLDCDNDGFYEFKGLKGSHTCRYKKSGLHQIAIRGQIPGLYLGDESTTEEDEAAADKLLERIVQKVAEENPGKEYDIIEQEAMSRLTWASAGEYHSGQGPRNMGQVVRSVDQWGDIAWKTTRLMFKGCSKMEIKAVDSPDFKEVSDMEEMFSLSACDISDDKTIKCSDGFW